MEKRLCARNGALRAPIGSSGHARPPPLGCGRSPPYLRLVTGVRLASPGSSLAEATFAPAQPPFMVTELLGEKTNLTQKKPYSVFVGRSVPETVQRRDVSECVSESE